MAGEKSSIYSYMTRRLNTLESGLKNGESRAELANLRRGIGRIPGDMPELWGIVLGELPEELLSKTGEPSKGEWAVYIALTLYAMHQQSKDVSMCEEGTSIGTAIGKLVKSERDRERVAQRFNMFASSADIEEASYHLRGLIQLLRAEGIPFDYRCLACDLYDFQWGEETRARVRLRWGQDFYYKKNDKKEEN